MIKDYGYEVQKLYLELMLADAEVFVRCQGIFDHTLFDRKLQDAAEFMNEYAKNYNVLPDFDMVNASCRSELKRPEDMKEGHMDWLLDEFENFTRHKALERAIISSAELLENKNYGEVEALIKEASREAMGSTEPLETPVSLYLYIRVPIPKSCTKKRLEAIANGSEKPIRKPDGSNILKSVEDGMNSVVYKDDSQIVNIHVSKVYSTVPGVDICVKECLD